MIKQNAYALAALDMDGTLLNTSHEISDYSRAVLERAAKAGKLLALSTGRSYSELKQHLASAPCIAYVIGESGACVYDARSREIIHRETLDSADVKAVFAAAEGLDSVRQCFIDGQSYMQSPMDESLAHYHIFDFAQVSRSGSRYAEDVERLCLDHPGRVGKINLYFSTGRDRDRFVQRAELQSVSLAESIGVGIEISPGAATKANGLKALCGHLGITTNQVMAVGDGSNDLDILRAAGLSVAMDNAIEAVRNAASVLTDDCDHDGAAKAIERYMLNADPGR